MITIYIYVNKSSCKKYYRQQLVFMTGNYLLLNKNNQNKRIGKNEKKKFHPDRIAGRDRDHRYSGVNAAAGT
jgi:hypothetical protein